jgi:excisionase family DNA binding protein
MAASGHEYPVYALAEEHSTSQDDEWLSVDEAASELELSRRQVRRLAEAGLGTRKGREWRLSKSKVLALKAERDWRARIGSRHFPTAA